MLRDSVLSNEQTTDQPALTFTERSTESFGIYTFPSGHNRLFAKSHRFWYIVFLFSFISEDFYNFLSYIHSDTMFI